MQTNETKKMNMSDMVGKIFRNQMIIPLAALFLLGVGVIFCTEEIASKYRMISSCATLRISFARLFLNYSE